MAGHDGPESLREVGGHDAEGAEVVLASFDHLEVVDPGELGVLFAGCVSGPDERGPQQRRPGFGHRLAFAVGVAGL